MLALAVAGERYHAAGGACPPQGVRRGHRSRAGGLGLAGAGASMLIGVSSAKIASAEDMAPDGVGQRLQQGGGLAHPVGQGGPVQIKAFALEDLALAVEGRWSAYLLTRTWASRPGPGDRARWGARAVGTCTKRSQHEQVSRGRTIRFTMKRPGTYSSSSVTSSPIRRRRPPQSAQASARVSPPPSRDVVRDRTTLRFVLLLDVRQLHPRGHRGGGDLAGLRASCNCSAVSDDAPNRCARCPAS